jgi:hypothetical protein
MSIGCLHTQVPSCWSVAAVVPDGAAAEWACGADASTGGGATAQAEGTGAHTGHAGG